MSLIICAICGGMTTWEGGFVAEHHRRMPPLFGEHPCPGGGMQAREASPPKDCPACGEPLSLATRSRPSLFDRRHAPAECIAVLRARVAGLAARLDALERP